MTNDDIAGWAALAFVVIFLEFARSVANFIRKKWLKSDGGGEE